MDREDNNIESLFQDLVKESGYTGRQTEVIHPYKHKDFIFLDLVCLFLSLILAYLVRNGSVRNIFELGIYHNMIFFVILADLFLIIIFESYKGVLRRGYYQELRSVIQQMILIELASGLYLFTVSNGHSFSRTVLYLMGVFYVLLSYGTRII